MKARLRTLWIFLLTIGFLMIAHAQDGPNSYFELRIYHFENAEQEKRLDDYLAKALIPALHRLDRAKVGVFKARDGQRGSDSTLYLLIPHPSFEGVNELNRALMKDMAYLGAGKEVLQAKHDQPAFSGMQVILMKAFESFPGLGVPELDSPRKDRIYELRSYESATEDLYRRKVAMFNQGEAEIFVRLGFQPVFFGDVLAGDKMPRLLYLTTNADQAQQEAHWKAFRTDPKWEEMKLMQRYAHTVSHIDKWLLYPTEYSDY